VRKNGAVGGQRGGYVWYRPRSAVDASVAQSMQSRENLNCCSKTFDRDARARTHTRRHDVVIARRRG